MIVIGFEGWFQCRLATDLDPADEPRGISGWTFAVAGEPDLDRIIRLQDPVAPRAHAPTVGVTVRSVLVSGEPAPNSPLMGARVELLDGPKFEGRNGIVAEDTLEFIHPFHIRILGQDIRLSRRDVLDVDDEGNEVNDLDAPGVQRRQPTGRVSPAEVASATGVDDFVAYLRARLERLTADLQLASDETERVALETRIAELGTQPVPFVANLAYAFDVRGPAHVSGNTERFGGEIEIERPWPIEFWVGGWDADALTGYMRGTLQIPVRHE